MNKDTITSQPTPAGQSSALALPPDSALRVDGPLTDEVVRDVWCKLNDRLNRIGYMGDPLSKTERELYETMTAWLTLRGKPMVAASSKTR